ncbi:MAG TPA: MotA/TolQ/ExbB proton channel family protein [Burkholderiales bacterium]|nr:MotA/TolQ/ExbB proton channel family protein [Burkholderiales bacterium]
MTIAHLISLANDSGGTLYLMLVLLLIALTVTIERARYLANMQHGGARLIALLAEQDGRLDAFSMPDSLARLPHARLFDIVRREGNRIDRATLDEHLEEVIMHEVPLLDRSLWMLDTVITLAPLMGLFGTIIGMFNAFHVLSDIQNNPAQITGGIAEALIATASGLCIAMIGLVAYNALNTRVRTVLHQLETIKLMLVNRCSQLKNPAATGGHNPVGLIRSPVRA